MTGALQINIGTAWEGIDYPFLDLSKTAVTTGWDAPSASEDPYLLLDDDEYMTRMPAGASLCQRITAIYNAGDRWVLRWSGSGTCVLVNNVVGLTITPDVVTANRAVYSISAPSFAANAALSVFIRLTAITNGNHPTNIQLVRESEEALLDAGEIFAQHFVTKYSGFGRIRFMNWMRVNDSPIVKWDHRCQQSHSSWRSGHVFSAYYCGAATNSGNAYTGGRALSVGAWSHGQMAQAKLTNVPTFYTITAATKANPCQLTVVGHPFVTGDYCNVGLFFSGMTQLAGIRATVTVLDADTFTLDGINSTAFSTFTGGSNRVVYKDVTFTDGVLSAKRVVRNTGSTLSNDLLTANALVTLVYDSDLDALLLFVGGAVNGVPPEVVLALANKVQTSAYCNLPTMANDDYVTQFVTLARDTLTTWPLCLALGNEVWNSSFSQTGWASTKATILFGSITAPIDQWYGYRFYQVMTIAAAIFAGQANRLKRIFEVWTVPGQISNQETYRYKAPNAGVGAWPITLADGGIAIAPYLEANRSNTANAEYVWRNKQGGADQQLAFDWLDAKLRAVDGANYTLAYFVATMFPNWKASAESYGVPLTQYEGGWGAIPGLNALTASSYNGDALSSTDRDNLFYDFYTLSPYTLKLIQDCFFAFTAAGGEYPSQFCLVGTWGSSFGMFGTIRDNIFGIVTPAYESATLFNARKRRVALSAAV